MGRREEEFREFQKRFSSLKRSLVIVEIEGAQMKKAFKSESEKLNKIEEGIVELHGKWFVKIFSAKGIDFKELNKFKNDIPTFSKIDELIQSTIEQLSVELDSFEKEYIALMKKREALMAEMKGWLNKTKYYPNFKLEDSTTAVRTNKKLSTIKNNISIMQKEHANALELIRENEKASPKVKIQLLEQIIAWKDNFNAQSRDTETFEALDSIFVDLIATLDSINDIESWKKWLLKIIQARNISGICNMRFSDSEIEDFITVGSASSLKKLEFKSAKMIIKKEASLNRVKEFSNLDLSLLNTTEHDFSHKFRKAFASSKHRWRYDEMILQTTELKDKIKMKLNEMNTRLNQSIADSTKRHFKRERFNMLIVSSIDRTDKEFIKEKKSDWPIYPNYHLVNSNISNSTLKHEVIDELVKLPVRSELTIECIDNGLKPEHAKILEHMDEDGKLIEIHKKGVAVELILSLKEETEKGWYDALLEEPDFHEQIAIIRSKKFHSGLWKKLKIGIIEVWQYHVIAGTEFDDEQLDDMCEAEDVWGEAEGFYAPNYDLERRFKTLKSVYGPKNSENDGKRSIISTDDIFDAVREVTECTRDPKREIRSIKVKQSKEDPFANIFN